MLKNINKPGLKSLDSFADGQKVNILAKYLDFKNVFFKKVSQRAF